MNILTLVFTLLLTLSIITYTRLEKYKSFATVQAQYNQFIQNQENVAFNLKQRNAAKRYSNRSFKRLSLDLLFQEKGDSTSSNSKQKERQKIWLTELIKILYHHTSFYQKMQLQNDHFVEELVDEVLEARKQVDPRDFINADGLMKIRLQNPEMQQVFYAMLKGTKVKEPSVKSDDYDEANPDIEFLEEDEDKNLDPQSYYSLLQFIRYKKENIKIGLASKEVLAVFFEPAALEKVLMMRQQYRQQIKADATQKQILTNQFTKEASPLLKNQEDKPYVDFSLTAQDILD